MSKENEEQGMTYLKRVLFVATVVKTHIVKFHIPALKLLKCNGWETAVAARNDYDDPAECQIPFCDTYYDISFEREPLRKQNLKAFWELKRIIEQGRYDMIHCHTPVGAMLARLAAIAARKRGTKVIYTAHGFHFYKGAPLKNWLLYYPVEWLLSWFTDVLITINKEDYARAKKSFHAKETVYMPGVGIDLEKFDTVMTEEERLVKRAEIGVPASAKLLISVGELNQNKNHEVILRAMAKLNDPEIHYCIAGTGPHRDALINLAEDLGLANRVHLLGYRKDVAQLYQAGDVCCFPSYREGLPVSVLEAIACGLPVIAADNRGTRDIIVDEVNGILCQPNDVDAFANAIQRIFANPENAQVMAKSAKESIQRFSVENAVAVLREIYQR